jgi:hypothetical protein
MKTAIHLRSKRSPDERSDIRVCLARGPACRCAHAGYPCIAAGACKVCSTDYEVAAIEELRFRERMATRATAARELLRRGMLAAAGDKPDNSN